MKDKVAKGVRLLENLLLALNFGEPGQANVSPEERISDGDVRIRPVDLHGALSLVYAASNRLRELSLDDHKLNAMEREVERLSAALIAGEADSRSLANDLDCALYTLNAYKGRAIRAEEQLAKLQKKISNVFPSSTSV